MKAEYVNRFKFTSNPESQTMHLVFEQEKPTLRRNEENQVDFKSRENIDVAALYLDNKLAINLANQILNAVEPVKDNEGI